MTPVERKVGRIGDWAHRILDPERQGGANDVRRSGIFAHHSLASWNLVVNAESGHVMSCHSLVRLALLLSHPINVRMYHPHVSCESIVSREGLLLGAQVTSYFEFAGVVDRVFVPR